MRLWVSVWYFFSVVIVQPLSPAPDPRMGSTCIKVSVAETDVLFLPVIRVITDRLAAGQLVRQWWERMGEQRHPSR